MTHIARGTLNSLLPTNNLVKDSGTNRAPGHWNKGVIVCKETSDMADEALV